MLKSRVLFAILRKYFSKQRGIFSIEQQNEDFLKLIAMIININIEEIADKVIFFFN